MKKDEILTAKELFYQNNKKELWDKSTVEDYIIPSMIEFAKLHVTAALKAASEGTFDSGLYSQQEIINDILNSYPLEKIK